MAKQEIEFAKKIEEIRKLAKNQGMMVTKEQVEELFGEIGMEGDDLNPIYDYLKVKKIGVGETPDLEKGLSEEDRNFLEMYFEEMRGLPEYSQGEKEAYFLSAMAGEKDGKKKTIEIMLPSVADIAKLYAGQGILMEDLIGEGNVALASGVDLLGALEKPDEVESSLAKMVMNAMEAVIANEEHGDSENRKMLEKINRITDAAKALSEDYGRKITVKELAGEGCYSEDEIEDAIRISSNHIPYFEGAEED